MPTQSQISNLFTKITDLMTCANTDTVSSSAQSDCGGWSLLRSNHSIQN